MARLPYLDPPDLAEDDRDLLKRNINLYRALTHSPDGTRHFQRLGHWIRYECALDPRLREMAILQVGYLARSAYEYSHHIGIGRDFGVSDDDVRAIATETTGGDSGLPALDRAVLRAAREMTESRRIADPTYAELEAALGHKLLVELVLVIGFYNAVVRVLETLEIDVEPDYQGYLDTFPLP